MADKFPVEAWFAAASSHDAEQLRAFLLPETRYEDVPSGTVNEGVEAVLNFFQMTWSAIPDFKMEPQHAFQSGDDVAAEWLATGTHLGDFPGLPATGNAFHARGVSLMQVAGDKLRRVSDFCDLATSGLLPMPTAAHEAASADGSTQAIDTAA
ncbi:MAG TPA: ester cyclase [Herpetosiphonaceae bacterium]